MYLRDMHRSPSRHMGLPLIPGEGEQPVLRRATTGEAWCVLGLMADRGKEGRLRGRLRSPGMRVSGQF